MLSIQTHLTLGAPSFASPLRSISFLPGFFPFPPPSTEFATIDQNQEQQKECTEHTSEDNSWRASSQPCDRMTVCDMCLPVAIGLLYFNRAASCCSYVAAAKLVVAGFEIKSLAIMLGTKGLSTSHLRLCVGIRLTDSSRGCT